MRVGWAGLTIDAIDYEIVRLSGGSAPPEVGRFSDVYVDTGPPFRLVAGYLMLEASAPERLRVHSHGVPMIDVHHDPNGLTCSPARESETWVTAGEILSVGGVAVAPGAGGFTFENGLVTSAGNWSFTLVHGPSREKIDARVALHESLLHVGGRHG